MNNPPDVTISYELAARIDWVLQEFSNALARAESYSGRQIQMNGYVASLSLKLAESAGCPSTSVTDPLVIIMRDKVIEIFTRKNPECLQHDRFADSPNNLNPETPHDRTDPEHSTFFEFKLTRDHPPGPPPQG